MRNADRILAAATHAFAKRGFGATSLQTIADDVGIAKQSLLYHYASKEKLRQAVMDALFAHWAERLPAIFDAVTSGYKRFDALTEELLKFFQQDPDWARLIVREMLDNPSDMQALFSENLRPWTLLVAQFIKEGQRSGLIHEEVDAEAYVVNAIVATVAVVAAQPVLETMMNRPSDRDESGSASLLRELNRMNRVSLFKKSPSARSHPTSAAPLPPQEPT